MAKNYAQIAKQIEALQQQADTLKQKELAGVVGSIKLAIAFYDLTPSHLGFAANGKAAAPAARAGKTGTPKVAVKKAAAKRGSVVRYRDGNGNTWTGMGPKPRWLAAGLASGKSLSDFAAAPGA